MKRTFTVLLLAGPAIWVLAMLLSVLLSEAFGCEVHSEAPDACRIAGIDFSGVAGALESFAAWGPLIVGPFMAAVLIVWGVVSFVQWLRRPR